MNPKAVAVEICANGWEEGAAIADLMIAEVAVNGTSAAVEDWMQVKHHVLNYARCDA